MQCMTRTNYYSSCSWAPRSESVSCLCTRTSLTGCLCTPRLNTPTLQSNFSIVRSHMSRNIVRSFSFHTLRDQTWKFLMDMIDHLAFWSQLLCWLKNKKTFEMLRVQLTLWVPSFLTRNRPWTKKSESDNTWERNKCHWRIRQLLVFFVSWTTNCAPMKWCSVLPLLDDPLRPNRSESLYFHGSVLAKSVHVHLSHALDFQLLCVLT